MNEHADRDALRRVKAILKARGLENVELAGRSKGAVRSYYLNVAEGLRQAIAYIQEEQDRLAREEAPRCNWCPGDGTPLKEFHPEGSVAHVLPRPLGTEVVNESLNRRRA